MVCIVRAEGLQVICFQKQRVVLQEASEMRCEILVHSFLLELFLNIRGSWEVRLVLYIDVFAQIDRTSAGAETCVNLMLFPCLLPR